MIDMMGLSRRITALLLAVTYVWAGVAGIAHLEHHHHHTPVLQDGSNVSPAVHHCCSCHHHKHADTADSCETNTQRHHGPACPHDHGQGDCPVCQSLAQKPAPIAVVAIVSAPQLLFERPEDPAVTPEQPAPALPLSRGPPVCG